VTAYVALVRGVNVAGTGKLPKDELKAMGEACGFEKVRTFINSGNLLFTSDLAERTVKQRIEEKLSGFFSAGLCRFSSAAPRRSPSPRSATRSTTTSPAG
jgi:uncharacterized protein (DUF1697 family)